VQARVRAESVLIAGIQKRGQSPYLLHLARGFSFLGNELYYIMVLLALCVWVRPQLAYSFGLLLAFSLYVGNFMKNLFYLPRPGAPAQTLERNHDWGFPSTHAMCAVTLPFFLLVRMADSFRTVSSMTLAIVCACLYSLAIMASRIYLGVHSFFDLLGGIFFGVPLLLGFLHLEPWLWQFVSGDSRIPMLLIMGAALLAYFHPEPHPTTSFYVSTLMMGTASGGFVVVHRFKDSIISRIPVLQTFQSLRERLLVAVWRFLLVGGVALASKELAKVILNSLLPPMLSLVGFVPITRQCMRIENLPSFSHDSELERLLKTNPKDRTAEESALCVLVNDHNERRKLGDRTIDVDVIVKFVSYFVVVVVCVWAFEALHTLGLVM